MTALMTPSEQHAFSHDLHIRRFDATGEAVVRVEGQLELATAARLREELDRASAANCERIIVDLSALEFIDSMGIHALVQAHHRCHAAGRRLTLLLEPGLVQRTLELSGVLNALEHITSDAVAA